MPEAAAARSLQRELELAWESSSGDSCSRWTGELSDDWSFRSPAGGVLSALGVHAMAKELERRGLDGAAWLPLSVTATFCSVVVAGPVEVDVTLLRMGRAVCQLRASVRSLGATDVGLEVTASFGLARSGPEFVASHFPEVTAVGDSPSGTGGVPFAPNVVPRFFQRFETRRAVGADFWSADWAGGGGHHARWVRFHEPPLGREGYLEPAALIALADTMPPSVVQYLGSGFEPFIAPSLDLTVHLIESTRRPWLLCSARSTSAYRGYAAARIEIWDDARRLLAVGTQVMMLRRRPQL